MGGGRNSGLQEDARSVAIFGKVEVIRRPNVGTRGESNRGRSH